MGSINKSHHESTGGVVIFNGELILLYCDAVQCDVKDKGSVKGRIYLTTHRILFTSTPINQNPNLKSFCAPFYAMFDLDLEQPVFGANYIKGKVRSEGDGQPFSFKLKFNKGGAIEFGQTMANAAKSAERMAHETNFQPPPAYTPTATESYYQASNAYQPQYPVGFALPTQMFNEPPPAGFVFASDAPPPYPGITPMHQSQPQQQGFPQQQQQQGYPPYQNGQQPQQQGYPPYAGNTNGNAAPWGAPSAPGYSPSAPTGYAGGFEQPPSYGDATKKQQ